MGNESSALVKLRRGSKDKQPAIIEYSERSVTPVYKKKMKSPRSISHGRVNEKRRVTPPIIESDNISIKSTATGTPKQLTVESAELNYLQPLTPDRKRSRSLCTAQLLQDTQAAAAQKQLEDRGSGVLMTNGNRKMSTGIVPQLNRLRIQQCFKAARPTMGDAILKRAASNRSEFRAFMGRLNDQQAEHMGKQFFSLIAESVENIERVELIQQHARAFGETYAGLCQLGFRPDFFSALADAAIAECVKLDGGAHKRCETLLAWSQLIGAIFTSVRDGYYNRVRYQRRSSLPQNTLSKQLSLEFSKSIDHEAYVQ